MMNDGAIALISGSIKNLETITSGFNADGTELTVTKLNGYNFYSTVGGSLSKPGPAPWIVGVKTDGATEIGWMLDFHRSHTAGNVDYTCRIECTEANTLRIPNIIETGNITSANITTLTNRITAEETKSTDFETRIANEETKSVSIDLRLTDEETNNALMRIDINAMDDRLIEEEAKSIDFETRIANEELKSIDFETRIANEELKSIDFETRIANEELKSIDFETRIANEELKSIDFETRIANEETKSVSMDTRLTTAEGTITSHGTRLTTAEGTITSVSSRLGAVEGSATAINNRITRIMGTYYYPNGYDDPNNSDFRTLEWVVDYMLKNIIPTLGDLEGSNTLQSWLIGIFGAASFAEGIASAAVIKQINATLVVHGTQLAAHAMTLEANLITMSAIEVDIAAIKASVALTAGQVLGLMILGGSVGVGLYALINRGNGPMKQSTVPDKYEPITNDTDPIALIGYTDPIARIVEGSAYELVDSRLIKFDGSDAKIVPQKLKVEEVEATILNGITITEYATNDTLINYVPKSVLNNYVMKTPFQLLSSRVGDIETILVYGDDGIESTLNINVGDALLMTCVNNGTITTTMYGNVVVEKLNNVLISDYVTNTSLTTTLNNYVLSTTLNNYVQSTTLNETLNNYVLSTTLVDYVINTSLTTSLTTLTNKTSGFNSNGTELTVTKINNMTIGGGVVIGSAALWIATIDINGVCEVGRIIDFHTDYSNINADNTCRVTCSAANTLSIPNITATGNITSANITTLTTKTTSLSYAAAATTISNALRLPTGISIDRTNSIVYYGTNMRVEKWWVSPWGEHVNDALILLDHINTTAYGNEVRMLCGRIDLIRHHGAWSHGVYVDITLIHFGIETVPQISNINYVSYNTDGTEPHAREPRLALVTHTASSKQYIAIHVPFYVNSGRVHFSAIMSTLSDSIPMLMCLPSDGYVINESPYDVYAKKQEWNHGLRCIGNIEAPNVVAVENKVSGFNTDGTELTLTKLNGLSMNDYVTDGALQFLLNGYVDLGSLDDYATTSSLNTLAGRVTTLETKTSRLSYTSAMDLLTISSGVTLSQTLLVNGTTEDTISISCPNGKVMATNINVTNKDDIEALQTKTSGFNSNGTELTLTKLNGYNFHNTTGSTVPPAPWIPGVKTDGVMKVGQIIDFHTNYTSESTNYTCRVTCNGNSLTIPNIATNSVTCSGNVTGSNITTLETKTTGLSYSGGTTVFNAVPKIGNESLIDFFYPVGTLYQSSDNAFNPNTKWGGTWVKIEGRFILGSNSTKLVGNTGGNEKVTIEGRHLPDHTHTYSIHSPSFEEAKIYNSVTDTTRLYASSANVSTGNTSGWKSVSQIDQLDIMPPYEVVNIWKRTA